jgi:DNA replication licensing factor MCM2
MLLSCRDYAPNELLDRYSDAGIDDDGDVEDMSAAARRAAEMKMARRDRMERSGKRGQRAARRSRAPAFLGSDDMEDDDIMDDQLGISSMKRRTRKQYDERRDIDDLDGVEDVSLWYYFVYVFIADPNLRKFR